MGEVDLVVRLRDHNRSFNCISEEGGLCFECLAADEIERLRAEMSQPRALLVEAFQAACNENVELRAAGFDVIQRIETWEAAVRTIIGRDAEHGMDLTRLRAALHKNESGTGGGGDAGG